MRWSTLTAAAAGLIALGFAGTPAVLRCEEPGEPSQQRPGLLARQESVRLAVIGGRIEAVIFGEGQASEEYGSRRELLIIATSDTGTAVSYESVSPGQRLTVACNEGQVTIREQWSSDGPSESDPQDPAPTGRVVEYRQTPQGVELEFAEGDRSRHVQARTLWHLLIAEPELCRRQLIPVLEKLRPKWNLMETAQATKDALLQIGQSRRAVDKQRWEALVVQLADQHFAVRQQADRQLRVAGEVALPYLESLARRDLDAEQWRRVGEIVASYETDRDDAAERIAMRMAGDRAIWIELLGDPQQSRREIALAQLNLLSSAPVEFDPAASPETRAKQLEKLRLLARYGGC